MNGYILLDHRIKVLRLRRLYQLFIAFCTLATFSSVSFANDDAADFRTSAERRNMTTAYDINVVVGFFDPRPGSPLKKGSIEDGIDWSALQGLVDENMMIIQTGGTPLESESGDGVFRGISGYKQAVDSWVQGFDGEIELRYIAASAHTVAKLLRVTFSDDARVLDWFEIWQFNSEGLLSTVHLNYVDPLLANEIFRDRKALK